MRLSNVSKTYHNRNGDVVALNHISLSFHKKGMTFIVGPSGCGKTTIMNILSKKNFQFEGEIEIDGTIGCITQDILLFENLSIKDNLLLVSDDPQKVNDLITKFGFVDGNVKAKKLSLGEKRRVQIIRSLLSNVDYLLCDEPTASLDYENRHKVMQLLKEISNDISVIVVTHDLLLVEQYASYIIKMGKACILSADEPVNNGKNHCSVKKEVSVPLKKQVLFLFKTIKSRLLENIFVFGIVFLFVSTVFIGTSLFPSLNASVAASTNWYNGKNVIITQPKSEIQSISASNYDIYTKEDVYYAKDNIDGLLGYRIGWNIEKYDWTEGSSIAKKIEFEDWKKIIEKYQSEYEKTGIEPFIGYEASLSQINTYDITDEKIEFYDYSHYYGLNVYSVTDLKDMFLYALAIIPEESQVYIKNSLLSLTPYQLFEDVIFAVQYGKMPQNNNEILITPTVAEFLLTQYHLSDYSELIDYEISLTIQRSVVQGVTEQEKYSQYFPFVISGITYDDSNYENQIFFLDGAYEKCMVELFEYQPNECCYQYITFLVDPSKNAEAITEELNSLLKSEKSEFELYNLTNMDYFENYQDSLFILIFLVVVILILLMMYVALQLFTYQRVSKENSILKSYRYSPIVFQLGKGIVIFIGVGFIHLCSLSYLCEGLNKVANMLGLASVVTYHFSNYLVSLVLSLLVFVLLEGGIYALRNKKCL